MNGKSSLLSLEWLLIHQQDVYWCVCLYVCVLGYVSINTFTEGRGCEGWSVIVWRQVSRLKFLKVKDQACHSPPRLSLSHMHPQTQTHTNIKAQLTPHISIQW